MVKASFANNSFMAEVGRIIVLVYLFLVLVQVIVNLHNRPEAVDKIHLGCALYFVLFMLLFTGLTLRYDIHKEYILRELGRQCSINLHEHQTVWRLFIVDDELVDTTTKIGAVISMGGGLVISVFHGSFISIAMSGSPHHARQADKQLESWSSFDLWKWPTLSLRYTLAQLPISLLVGSSLFLQELIDCVGLQYWLMQPVYMNILQIHAFCNTHDISWGTKNLDKSGAGQGQDYKHTMKKGHLNSAQQKKESKAFWDARLKVRTRM